MEEQSIGTTLYKQRMLSEFTSKLSGKIYNKIDKLEKEIDNGGDFYSLHGQIKALEWMLRQLY